VPKIMQERRDNIASRQGKENTEVEEHVGIGVMCHDDEQGDGNREGFSSEDEDENEREAFEGDEVHGLRRLGTTYIPGSFATADRATFALSISLMSLWSIATRPLGSLT
jgi:hypothetical protein